MDGEFAMYRESGLKSMSKTDSALITLVAGSIAGAVSRTCTAPFDRLKMVMQVDPKYANLGIVGGMREIYQNGKTHRVGYDGQFKWQKVERYSQVLWHSSEVSHERDQDVPNLRLLLHEICKSYVLAYQNRSDEDEHW